MEQKNRVFGIGNAICDIIIKVSDEFLDSLEYKKSSMQLVTEEDSDKLLEKVAAADLEYTIHSGGSVANTIYYLSKLEITTCFVGNVSKGSFGQKFLSDLTKQGVKFINVHDKTDNRSAKCIVLVTPDGERTMCTYLGCAGNLALSKIPDFHIDIPHYIYTESYLFDNIDTANNLDKFIKRDLLKNSGFVLSLSDSECVKRNRDMITYLIKDEVRIVIGNESEFAALIGKDHIDNDGLKEVQSLFSSTKKLNKALVTFGEKGTVLITEDNIQKFPTTPLKPVDSTGAGDSFAAGYLGGMLKGCSEEESINAGHFIAGQVIAEIGARINVDLPKFDN